jgi:PhnB protein
MKPADLARKLRREAAFEPAALDRGKAVLMAAIRQEVEPKPRPTIVPQVPYQDIGAALAFLERAFGFREIPTARLVMEDGVIGHALVEFGDGVIGIGTQGAHGAISPKRGGTESQYISVYVADVDAHYQQALAAGSRIASGPHDDFGGVRGYEALDPEGHRWRFHNFSRPLARGGRTITPPVAPRP